jgi:hypothetical protein
VQGVSAGVGVHGVSYGQGEAEWPAVLGNGAVSGENQGGGFGVLGLAPRNDGVRGVSESSQHAGVLALNLSSWSGDIPSCCAVWAGSHGTGVYAQGSPAGYFDGDVQVTGDLILINSPSSLSGDVAEDFDVEDRDGLPGPGTVLVIGPDGKLLPSADPYDTRVAGVVSGAGDLQPAVVLQRVETDIPRLPIALVGKAFCKVDAAFGPISPGDLLTTSPTPGHAMKVLDRSRALGTILGKALSMQGEGQGLIPILLALR